MTSQRGAEEFRRIKRQFEITPDPELLVKRGFLPHPTAVLHGAIKIMPKMAAARSDEKDGRRKSLEIIREQVAEVS